jgi:SH3-like domain-containing protein
MKSHTSSRSILRRLALVGLAFALAATGIVTEGFSPRSGAAAQEVGPSGLPLPRFVSLRANRVNLRVGPGTNYAVEWMYTRSGIPMEIIQEYDNWRRVRDAEGAEGWINQSLLSGNRTAVAAPWHKGKDVQINLHREANRGAAIRAILEPGVIASVRSCNGEWCEVEAGGHRGWVEQAQLWGVYPGETYTN